MLDRDGIWSANQAQNYFLHMHLVHDWEHYRHFNADLNESFGVVNDFAQDCKKDIEERIAKLTVDPDLCVWAVPAETDRTTSLSSKIKHSAVRGAFLATSVRLLLGASLANTLLTASIAALGTAIGIDSASAAEESKKTSTPRPRVRPQSAKATFLNVRKTDATSLEKAALGLTYQALF